MSEDLHSLRATANVACFLCAASKQGLTDTMVQTRVSERVCVRVGVSML